MPLKRISVYFSNGSSVNLRTIFQVILHEGFDSVFKPSFKSVHLTTPLQQSTPLHWILSLDEVPCRKSRTK